jgi:hypothetical protein
MNPNHSAHWPVKPLGAPLEEVPFNLNSQGSPPFASDPTAEEREEKKSITLAMESQQSGLSFQMKVNDFKLLRSIFVSSFPIFYGLDAMFALELDELIHRVNNNLIKEKDEFTSDKFIL